jgi:hypothetical protein
MRYPRHRWSASPSPANHFNDSLGLRRTNHSGILLLISASTERATPLTSRATFSKKPDADKEKKL